MGLISTGSAGCCEGVGVGVGVGGGGGGGVGVGVGDVLLPDEPHAKVPIRRKLVAQIHTAADKFLSVQRIR